MPFSGSLIATSRHRRRRRRRRTSDVYSQPALAIQLREATEQLEATAQLALRCVLAADTRFLISVTLFYWASAKNI